MYWLKRPTLPVIVCSGVGAGAASAAKPTAGASAEATTPAIAIFRNIFSPFLGSLNETCGGGFSTDHASRKTQTNQCAAACGRSFCTFCAPCRCASAKLVHRYRASRSETVHGRPPQRGVDAVWENSVTTFSRAEVMDPKIFSDVSARMREVFATSPAADLDKNLRAMLASLFTRLDLVTREEFD